MDEKQRLLYKFSKRECSAEELKCLFKYVEADKEADYEKVMDEIWQELQTYPALDTSVSEEMCAQIWKGIQSNSSSRPKGRQLFLMNLEAGAKVACAFAGIVLSACLLYLLVLRTDELKHETPFATTTSVELPDGSVVTLNGNSTIHYRKEWKDSPVREVWLEGEAFFSVTHTADHQKFIVHTNNMQIEVLGTEFNVNHRRGETTVTLSSGVVRLGGKGKARKIKDVIMRPGEQASLNRHYEFDLKKVDARQFTSWKDDLIVFDHTPVRELAAMIEDTYGLKVVLQGDSIPFFELSGSLPANDIQALLGMLSETLDLHVEKTAHQVIIRENIGLRRKKGSQEY